jgi:homoserine kinase type II
MAVYTHIASEDMAALIAGYDIGTLVSAKGIAEGVENTNYMVETTTGRFILTVYEKRVNSDDLPFFLSLLDHLADKGCPVPRTIHDWEGSGLKCWNGKFLALIEFLPGVSVSHPTPELAGAVGRVLGQMHNAVADFPMDRTNAMGLTGWIELAAQCGDDLDQIQPGLKVRVAEECAYLSAHWPRDLPHSVIHADLFPDNVLALGNSVSGIIDFYFACTEIRAWDLAVTHIAWCFAADGTEYNAAVGDALVAGYREKAPISAEEIAAFNILARGACLRFLLTRAWDWLNTPAEALVKRHDPLAMLARLNHYAAL